MNYSNALIEKPMKKKVFLSPLALENVGSVLWTTIVVLWTFCIDYDSVGLFKCELIMKMWCDDYCTVLLNDCIMK